MLVAPEMGRAIIRIERNAEGSGAVSDAHPEHPGGFGITQPIPLFEVELSVPL
jgi:hypothetical protein